MEGFSDIGVFTRVVQLGGFTRAAHSLGLTASGVSRIVSRLEDRLGVRLLNRTTRSLSLTAEGAAYHERCANILAQLEDANAMIAQASTSPRGRLRIELPIVLSDFVVGPALPRFLERHPEVSIDLTVRDRVIDPTAEGMDVVVRLAPSRESELVSRRLARVRSLVLASPAYLARHGRPRSLEELRKHACVFFLASTGPLPWRFKDDSGEVTFTAAGRLVAGAGNMLTHAALAGLGIIQTFEYHVTQELARGELEVLLEELEPEPRTIHALFAKQKATLPKVRAFVDFLVEVFASVAAPGHRPRARGGRGAGGPSRRTA